MPVLQYQPAKSRLTATPAGSKPPAQTALPSMPMVALTVNNVGGGVIAGGATGIIGGFPSTVTNAGTSWYLDRHRQCQFRDKFDLPGHGQWRWNEQQARRRRTATLTNGSVRVAAGGTFAPSTQYTILTATGGLGGTTFAGINTNLAFLTPSLSYNANNVFLTLACNNPAACATGGGGGGGGGTGGGGTGGGGTGGGGTGWRQHRFRICHRGANAKSARGRGRAGCKPDLPIRLSSRCSSRLRTVRGRPSMRCPAKSRQRAQFAGRRSAVRPQRDARTHAAGLLRRYAR